MNFDAVPTSLEVIEDEVLDTLSTDQRLLYEYVVGIANGRVETRFAQRKIGPMSSARWLTLAIRILALYVRGKITSEAGKQLVHFICQVYGPAWF